MKLKRGFTLIELLVVISIFSLLASIVLASLNEARKKARDSARMQNLKQLQNAVEMYKLDHGEYPMTDPYSGRSLDAVNGTEVSWTINGVSRPPIWYTSRPHYLLNDGSYASRKYTSRPNDWIPGLVPNYISSLPNETHTSPPSTYNDNNNKSNSQGAYAYWSDGRTYKISARRSIEGRSTWGPEFSFYDKGSVQYYTFLPFETGLPTQYYSWSVCGGSETVSSENSPNLAGYRTAYHEYHRDRPLALKLGNVSSDHSSPSDTPCDLAQ